MKLRGAAAIAGPDRRSPRGFALFAEGIAPERRERL
jgi:hypothetical protein